jgi:hypothetical protein
MSKIVLPTPLTRPGTPVTRTGLCEESVVGASSVCLMCAPGRRGARCAEALGLPLTSGIALRLTSTRQALFRGAALSYLCVDGVPTRMVRHPDMMPGGQQIEER